MRWLCPEKQQGIIPSNAYFWQSSSLGRCKKINFRADKGQKWQRTKKEVPAAKKSNKKASSQSKAAIDDHDHKRNLHLQNFKKVLEWNVFLSLHFGPSESRQEGISSHLLAAFARAIVDNILIAKIIALISILSHPWDYIELWHIWSLGHYCLYTSAFQGGIKLGVVWPVLIEEYV